MQRQNRIVRQNGFAPVRTNVHKHGKTTVKKKYKAVWALRLTDMSKDYVTLLSLNLLLCLHLADDLVLPLQVVSDARLPVRCAASLLVASVQLAVDSTRQSRIAA